MPSDKRNGASDNPVCGRVYTRSGLYAGGNTARATAGTSILNRLLPIRPRVADFKNCPANDKLLQTHTITSPAADFHERNVMRHPDYQNRPDKTQRLTSALFWFIGDLCPRTERADPRQHRTRGARRGARENHRLTARTDMPRSLPLVICDYLRPVAEMWQEAAISLRALIGDSTGRRIPALPGEQPPLAGAASGGYSV